MPSPKTELCTSLWESFGRTTSRRAEARAILHGSETITFADLRLRALEFAGWLCDLGVAPSSRVLLTVEPSIGAGAALLGTWAAGCVVALLDHQASDAQLRHAVRTIEPRVIVTDREGLPPFPGTVIQSPLARHRVVDTQHPRLPTDPASIVFTSGSTGPPKGVVQSHGNLMRGCAAVASCLGLTERDTILCPVPWSFDYGFGQLLSMVVLGVGHIVPVARNPFAVCDAIEQHRPTVLAGVPSFFVYMLRGVSPIRTTDRSSIRVITNTGGTIPAPILDELLVLFDGRRIFLNYGLTETYRSTYLVPELVHSHSDSIGRPIPGASILIVREDGTPADIGEVGEIVHRGDYICLGYWNDPAATAKARRPDPLAVSGTPGPPVALFTGDYGHLDKEGMLHFVGRRDHQLKCMGVRISPSEIEGFLYKSGLVLEVAVFGCKHELFGDEVWAGVVLQEDSEKARRALQDYARRSMTPYQLPRRWWYMEALPKTTSGKTDYVQLKAQAPLTR